MAITLSDVCRFDPELAVVPSYIRGDLNIDIKTPQFHGFYDFIHHTSPELGKKLREVVIVRGQYLSV